MSARIRQYLLMENWNYSVVSIIKATAETDARRKERMDAARKYVRRKQAERILKHICKPINRSFTKLKRCWKKSDKNINETSESDGMNSSDTSIDEEEDHIQSYL